MKIFKLLIDKINIISQCRKYGISLWQCPQFLFLIMGIIIILSLLIIYFLGNYYFNKPFLTIFLVFSTCIIFFIFAFIITNSFERLLEVARLKSEFISIASHHLRTPLTNLKWTIELLFSGKVNSIQENNLDYLKTLKENTEKMEGLLNELLIVSRIESDKLVFKKKEFFLQDLVKEVINKFEKSIHSLKINLNFFSTPDLPKTFADYSQIFFVVENLLDNAIRYSAEGKEISIRLEKKGKKIYFEIKDQGIGIPLSDQKYIFQKFFRSENILKYQTQGSGMGLFISRAIIEKSGGKIGFESQENKGSKFWFTLPIK